MMARPEKEGTTELRNLGCNPYQKPIPEVARALWPDERIIDAIAEPTPPGYPSGNSVMVQTTRRVLNVGEYNHDGSIFTDYRMEVTHLFWQDIARADVQDLFIRVYGYGKAGDASAQFN